MQSPVRGCTYSLATICNDLKLLDSPSLGIVINGRKSVIQNAHVLDDELLSIPKFADSLWEYKYTTNEWIPIFEYVGQTNITEFVDYENEINFDGAVLESLWVTPKGFPREQYYSNPNNRI